MGFVEGFMIDGDKVLVSHYCLQMRWWSLELKQGLNLREKHRNHVDF